MRITIVGSGTIGAALARHWGQDPSLHLTLTTTSAARLGELQPLAERVRVLRASEPEPLAAALAGAEVAVFCQAPSGSRQAEAATYGATYRDAFLALRQVLPGLPRLRQIVYTASCSVYGDAGGGWVDEQVPAAPADDHGGVLLESEALLAACRTAERAVCLLRLGAIHGPGRPLADRLARWAGTTRPGSGHHHCSWIHRDDVVGAIDAAVRERWDGLVNLVDDHPWRLADLLAEVCVARGLPPVRWNPQLAPPTPPADRRISNRRLRALGYRLRHPRIAIPRLTAIDDRLFAAVAEEARTSPRRRRNRNLHQHGDAVQRFLNVLQPGTYVRPHRHLRDPAGTGFECFLVLQGAIGLVLLDRRGELLECHRLDATGPLRGIELAEGQFHTLVALRPDSVIFELKQGPYQPATDKDFLAASPPEDSPAAAAWEQRWRALFADPAPSSSG
jgi:cupin fold WbuC family metalloprotein